MVGNYLYIQYIYYILIVCYIVCLLPVGGEEPQSNNSNDDVEGLFLLFYFLVNDISLYPFTLLYILKTQMQGVRLYPMRS